MAFGLDDCLELLLDARTEDFLHERVIGSFSFKPGSGTHTQKDALQLTQVDLPQRLFFENWKKSTLGVDCGERAGSRQITLAKLQTLSQSDEYRGIFTEFIASGGGWSRLLFTTPWAPEFDKRVKQRRDDHVEFIADLIDYRLRAALTLPEGQRRSGPTHAIFFKWWPNKDRFVTRTAFNRWTPFKRTAVFIYLIERRGFHMKPPCANDADFCEHLMHPQISKAQLQDFSQSISSQLIS